ncbi:MAG: hypothetical protein KDK89_18740 [Alphaproteobacteria bacterium]|nr:hypothetical protein [Alphaproteobacteria bacterium]
MTWEEYQASTPAAPSNLRLLRDADNHVYLFWDLPPVPPTGLKTAYDPVIAGFRVFRIAGQTDAAEIGTSRSTVFLLDAGSMIPGTRLAVATVQRSGHASELSAELVVPAR